MHEKYEIILREQKLGHNLKNIATKREISSVPLKHHFSESNDDHRFSQRYKKVSKHFRL